MKDVNSNYISKRIAQQIKDTDFSLYPSFPTNALVELTNGCNHKCIFCRNSSQSRVATFLNAALFEKFIKEGVALGLKEVGLYATGEPFMVKNIDKYISFAKHNGIERVYVTTNGALATLNKVKACVKAGLDSIKYSINAGCREDYKKIHGSDDFDRVYANVVDVFEWKNKGSIKLQLLCSCVTIPSMPETKGLHLQTYQNFFDDIVYNEASSQGGQSEDIVLDRSILNNVFQEKEEVSDNDISPCSMIFNRYHLTAEGYLTACCVDYDLNLVFCDLDRESLKDGWHNEHVRRLRRQHLNKNLEGIICNQCLRHKKCAYQPLRSMKADFLDEESRVLKEKKLSERIIQFKSD